MSTSQYDIAAEETILREAVDAYYNGTPIMSDSEFDRRIRNHRKVRVAYPEEFPTDTVLDRVGAPVPEGVTKLKHRYPMLSLDNVFEAEDGTSEDLRKWLSDLPPQTHVAVEPKLDGISLSIVYLNGVLARAVTRGDGSEGEDVTAHVLASGMVPSLLYDLEVPWSGAGTHARESVGDYFEVRGEVVMSWDQFEKLQAEKEAAGETLAANPRNAAAGAMSLKDSEECARRGLEFVAYQAIGDLLAESHASALLTLNSLGFRTASALVMSADSALTVDVSDMKQRTLHKCNYPVDGLVIKVDSYRLRNDMGFTSRAPRWATALKFQQEKVTTILKAITVQVGRSGVLTPVAELEPVWVDGSTVRRATLHNEDQIRRLGLQVGDIVEVRKAAAIIPEIVRSVTHGEKYDEIYKWASENFSNTEEGRACRTEDELDRQRPPFDLVAHIGGKCPSCGGDDIRKSDRRGADLLVALDARTAGAASALSAAYGKSCATVDELPDNVVMGVARDNGYDESADEFRQVWKDKLADPHTQTAAEYFGIPASEVTAEQRSVGKSINHAVAYHATPETIQRLIERDHKSTVAWRCMNPHCPAQLAAKIQHLCSRKCLDIEGIGEEAADALAKRIYDDCCLNSAIDGDRFPTPLEMVMSIVGGHAPGSYAKILAALTWETESGGTMTFGESRAKKAVAAIERAKKLPMHRWLFALGIPSVGENTSKEISRLCEDINEFRYACRPAEPVKNPNGGVIYRIATGEDKASAELSKYEISSHLGPVSCKALVDFCASGDGTSVLYQIGEWDIKSDNYNPIPVKVETGSALNGKTVVITGTLSVTRDEMKALLEKAGAKVGGSVSAKTDFLVVGEKAGSKADKAAKLGVKVLTEAAARALL